MAYQEEEQARIKRQRSKQAIGLAMQGMWSEAVAANKDIIASFPNDVDAYNRLGKAYMELGEYALAKEAYQQALALDHYNTIAQKNLQRLARLARLASAGANAEGDYHKVDPQHFIEEAGKAGVVSLYSLAPPEVLARVVAGDQVYLKVDSPNLVVENGHGEYLGLVELKHAQRLIKLIEGGNRYSAAIISSSEDKLTVIIREVYQDPSQAGQRSFPAKKFEEPRGYASDRLIRKELEAENEDEEDMDYGPVSEEVETTLIEPPDTSDKIGDGE